MGSVGEVLSLVFESDRSLERTVRSWWAAFVSLRGVG